MKRLLAAMFLMSASVAGAGLFDPVDPDTGETTNVLIQASNTLAAATTVASNLAARALTVGTLASNLANSAYSLADDASQSAADAAAEAFAALQEGSNKVATLTFLSTSGTLANATAAAGYTGEVARLWAQGGSNLAWQASVTAEIARAWAQGGSNQAALAITSVANTGAAARAFTVLAHNTNATQTILIAALQDEMAGHSQAVERLYWIGSTNGEAYVTNGFNGSVTVDGNGATWTVDEWTTANDVLGGTYLATNAVGDHSPAFILTGDTNWVCYWYAPGAAWLLGGTSFNGWQSQVALSGDPSDTYVATGIYQDGSPIVAQVSAWEAIIVTNPIAMPTTNQLTSAEYSNLVARVGSLGTLATLSYAPTAVVATNAMTLASGASLTNALFRGATTNIGHSVTVSNSYAKAYWTPNEDGDKFMVYDDGASYRGGISKAVGDVSSLFARGPGASVKIKTSSTYSGTLLDHIVAHEAGWMQFNSTRVTNAGHFVVSSNLTVRGTITASGASGASTNVVLIVGQTLVFSNGLFIGVSGP